MSKMNIISHRGYWKEKNEQNTLASFKKSFQSGFGVETDIRDSQNELVISHDIASGDDLLLKDFFELYSEVGDNLPLAINVKSDGLQDRLLTLLKNYNVHNYFVFDMSVPDHYVYSKKNIKSFTRHSEIEPHPPLLKESKGVWLDQFIDDWVSVEVIERYIEMDKDVCIVSPELHGRDYNKAWEKYSKVTFDSKNSIYICTDFPHLAKEYFDD